MAPFITVGIASYNYARYLPRAFEAIKRQAFRDIEILYCDDGSTDDSAAVIQGFIRQNPEMNIRLICGKNGGVMENKNRILKNAKGKYLMLCDADDWMDDTCLEKLAQKAEETNADRIIAGFRNVIDRGETLETGQVEYLPDHPSRWNQFQHHGCLYKTAVYREHDIYFRPDHYPDDFDYVERFNLHCGSAAYVREVLYNFYHNGKSTSATCDPASRWYYLNLFGEITKLAGSLLGRLGGDDYWELEAAVMRIYFANLRSGVRNREEYRKQKAMLTAVMPDYRKNPILWDVRRSPYRPDAANMCRCMLVLDALHGLYPALAVYKMLHKKEEAENGKSAAHSIWLRR